MTFIVELAFVFTLVGCLAYLVMLLRSKAAVLDVAEKDDPARNPLIRFPLPVLSLNAVSNH